MRKEEYRWNKAKFLQTKWDDVTKPLLKRLEELKIDIPLVNSEAWLEKEKKENVRR